MEPFGQRQRAPSRGGDIHDQVSRTIEDHGGDSAGVPFLVEKSHAFHAVVRGMPQLSSAPVWASDIRAGAGLVLAGLVADGDTEVHDVFHIDRGYPLFVENLVSLGAEVERVS